MNCFTPSRHIIAPDAWRYIGQADYRALCQMEGGCLRQSAEERAGQTLPGHMGLSTMAERAYQIGGVLEVTSAPGRGATVRAVIPGATKEA